MLTAECHADHHAYWIFCLHIKSKQKRDEAPRKTQLSVKQENKNRIQRVAAREMLDANSCSEEIFSIVFSEHVKSTSFDTSKSSSVSMQK